MIIETVLRSGARLHGFRSGGGLRVLRIERNVRDLAYGEAPTFGEAMRHLADDLTTGGRRYEDVYGKIEPHYLTGTSTPDGDADRWLLRGCTIDVHAEDGAIVAVLSGWGEQKTPSDIVARTLAGETVEWASPRGLVYETSPYRFPNGDVGTSTRCLSTVKDGADPWMWRTTQTGRGTDVTEALAAAFLAEPIEAHLNDRFKQLATKAAP